MCVIRYMHAVCNNNKLLKWDLFYVLYIKSMVHTVRCYAYEIHNSSFAAIFVGERRKEEGGNKELKRKGAKTNLQREKFIFEIHELKSCENYSIHGLGC